MGLSEKVAKRVISQKEQKDRSSSSDPRQAASSTAAAQQAPSRSAGFPRSAARSAGTGAAGSAATDVSAETQGSAPAQAQDAPPSRFERQYSTASWNTVSTLQQLELQVIGMETQLEAHRDMINKPPPDGLPLEMRNQLAQVQSIRASKLMDLERKGCLFFLTALRSDPGGSQMHGDFNKLLANKIDAILTSARRP